MTAELIRNIVREQNLVNPERVTEGDISKLNQYSVLKKAAGYARLPVDSEEVLHAQINILNEPIGTLRYKNELRESYLHGLVENLQEGNIDEEVDSLHDDIRQKLAGLPFIRIQKKLYNTNDILLAIDLHRVQLDKAANSSTATAEFRKIKSVLFPEHDNNPKGLDLDQFFKHEKKLSRKHSKKQLELYGEKLGAERTLKFLEKEQKYGKVEQPYETKIKKVEGLKLVDSALYGDNTEFLGRAIAEYL